MKLNFHVRDLKLVPMSVVLASVWLSFIFVSNEILAGELSGRVEVLQQSGGGDWVPAADSSGVVVFITGFEEPPLKNKDKIFLDQIDKSFVPRTLAVTVGDTVVFRNKDSIYHNTWSVSPSKSFDLGQYKEPVEKTISFDKAGLVSIFCNIHPQMIASVLVLKNNKYVVTDPSGAYRITGIPAGHQQIRVWAEGADPAVQQIDVTNSSKGTFDFTVKEKLRSVSHLNKDGKPYERYP